MGHYLAGVLLLLSVLAGACRGNGEEEYRFTRFAMDTVVEYTILAPDHHVAREAMLAAHAEIERIDSLLWEENPNSQIYKFNHSQDGFTFSREVYEFLDRARQYYLRTEGYFDITLKPVLDLYGFGQETPAPPDSFEIVKHLPCIGMEHLVFDSLTTVLKKTEGIPTSVTVGGLAKGYAVDRAIGKLRAYGIQNAIINAGGDLYCLGTKNGRPWAVGIRHPDDPNALIDTLYLTNQAVASSGDYERYYERNGIRYHHLLDPETGRPARVSRSATVIAPTTEEADALATALFIAGKEKGLALINKNPELSGMVVSQDGERHFTREYPRGTGY